MFHAGQLGQSHFESVGDALGMLQLIVTHGWPVSVIEPRPAMARRFANPFLRQLLNTEALSSSESSFTSCLPRGTKLV